jgi:hypothetical protein
MVSLLLKELISWQLREMKQTNREELSLMLLLRTALKEVEQER